jgi:hypothetical protein
VAERRCHYCGRGFIPDPRVGDRQKACSVACQRLRKRENNRVFREKNPEYGRAPERYGYLKEWRRKHPDYQRRWREANKGERSSGEIKAERLREAIEWTERTYLFLCEIQAEIPLEALPMAAKKASFPLQAVR